MPTPVSVVIPTYNRAEKFLGRALDSVLAQTYPAVEAVVVDDNPPDSPRRRETQALMEKYTAAHDNVVYVRNAKNMGGSLARNAGVAAASGEYVTFLDDDDEYLPEKVARQAAFMDAGGYDMSFTDSRSYDASGRMVHYREHSYLKSADNDRETLLRAHLTHHLTPTNVYMFRKEKLLAIGGFEDASMGQEFYLMLRAIEKGLKIGYLHRADVRQSLHMEGRISQGRNKIKGEEALFAFKKTYFDRLPKRDVQYIVFRHYVVMGVAYKRDRQFAPMLASFAKAFCSAPGTACREAALFLSRLGRG